MKLLLRIGIFLSVVGLLAFIKIKFFAKNTDAGPKPAAGGAAPSGVSAKGYILRPERLDNKIFATGTVLALESVDLKPEVSGKITQLNLSEGRSVAKGQLLMKLNDADLQATLKKLYAQQKIADESVARLKKLLDIKGVSQDEYDLAINQANNIRADIEFTQAQIAKTELRAPFNGVIGLKSVSDGAYVTAQSPIATIQVLNRVKVDFTVPEKYAYQVRMGDRITFATEGLLDKFSGQVYAIDNQIDPVTRTLKIRASADNPGGKLKPGAFVKVDFSLKEVDGALMVPTEALIPILKGQQVFVARDGKATPVSVEVGIRTDAKIQILSGLQVGDTVITSGLMGLKPNTAVRFTQVQ